MSIIQKSESSTVILFKQIWVYIMYCNFSNGTLVIDLSLLMQIQLKLPFFISSARRNDSILCREHDYWADKIDGYGRDNYIIAMTKIIILSTVLI